MSITPGWTAQQIRDFVYTYESQPHGTKTVWLAGQGISSDQLRRWRAAVFAGNLEEGLIPREGLSVSMRRQIIKREAGRVAEIDQLKAQVKELKDVNEALGKAIGLLHKLSEQEPAGSTTTMLNDSSQSRTNS